MSTLLLWGTPATLLRFPYQERQPDGDVAFLLALTMVFLASLTLLFFFMYLRQEQKRRRIQLYVAEIMNTGNVATPFDLRVEEPSRLLTFELYHQNELLVERQTTAPVEITPATPTAATSNRARDALGTAREVGGLGSSLATMLPAPIAKPLMAFAQGISQMVMTATRADSLVKAGSKVSKSAGSLMAADKEGKLQPKTGAPLGTGTIAPVETRVVDRWFETPRIAPNGTLDVTIMVDWTLGQPSQRYPFRVMSQATQQPDTLQRTTNGVVALPHEAWWVKALPVFIGVAGTIAATVFILMVVVTVTIIV
jgi:hypothetical protein